MTTAAQTLRPPSRLLMLLEARAINEFGAFLGALPLLSLQRLSSFLHLLSLLRRQFFELL